MSVLQYLMMARNFNSYFLLYITVDGMTSNGLREIHYQNTLMLKRVTNLTITAKTLIDYTMC
jgi:hypothetical protein